MKIRSITSLRMAVGMALLVIFGSPFVVAENDGPSFAAAPPSGETQFNGRPVNPQRFLAKLVAEDKIAALDAASNNPAIARVAKLVASVVPFQNLKSLVMIELNDEGSMALSKKDEKLSASADASTQQSLLIKARIKEFTDTGLYEYVEPDYIVHASATPADAAFNDGRLWGLRNTGQSGGVAGADIEAVPAWDQTTGSSNVVVAVIDSGVRYTHQDLAANMWVNSGEIAGNGVDDDRNGYVDDVYGINAITNSGNPMDDNSHGTHCAGTIGGVANNSGATVGVAWNVRIMALKFLDSSGSGYTSDSIKCIDYAISKGVRIMSNSWGGGGYSQSLYSAIERARSAGALFVAAAGNEGQNNDSNPSYPASYANSNIIAVAALDRGDLLASFSNYGATKVHLGAPGVSIFSTIASSDSAYASYNGTSMATPHVSGVAALVLAKFPSLSLTDLKNRIIDNTRRVASLNGKVATGGAVSANLALGASTGGGMSVNISTRPSPMRAGQQGDILATITKSGSALTGATVTGTFQSQSLTFRDNGVSPDSSANDGVYTARPNAPGSPGTFTLPLSVTHPSSTPFSGSFVIDVAAAGPVNDDFAAATIIPQATTQLNGTNLGATAQTGEPAHVGTTSARVSVWWRWTPAQSGSATITTFNSNFDTLLAVHTGSQLGNLVRVASNDDSGGTLQSSVTFNATAQTNYYIAVDGYSGATGNIVLNVPPAGTLPATAPAFSRNPVNQTVQEGQTAAFSVTVTGSPTPTLYWRKDGQVIADGGRVSGSSTTTLQITGALPSDAGAYDCVATNNSGFATSAAAYLSVDSANTRPANDNFANRLPIVSGSSTNGSNDRATLETGELNHAGVSGGHSVWWTWTGTTAGQIDIDTFGSTYDTTLAVYQGTALNSLIEVASNNDGEAVRQSKVSFIASAGVPYQIAVDGYGPSAGNIRLNVATLGDGEVFPSPNVPRPIQDNSTLVSTLNISGLPTKMQTAELKLDLNISHPSRGNLFVTLSSPLGQVFTISNRAGGSEDDLVITDLPLNTFPSNSPSKINPNGTWTLTVRDEVSGDTGTLQSWGLRSPPPNYTLTVNRANKGKVTTQPNQKEFLAGTVVTLTAVPSRGYQFAGWRGSATGTSNPLSLTMNGNKSMTPSFTPQPPTVETPKISPRSKLINRPQSVQITSRTRGAQIYYTTDGSDPTPASTLYTGRITVSAPVTVKAKGFLSGLVPSAIATAEYSPK